MPFIETDRLKIITFTSDMMEAFLKGNREAQKLLPYKIPAEYPLTVYKGLFEYKIDRFRRFPKENEWEGMIIHKNDSTVMGDMGFKGGPGVEGVIDIGYSIVPSYRGFGYATEMGKAMVKWGVSQPDVKNVVATCNPDNLPSIRVLEKIGFHITQKTSDKIYWVY